jgi:hypothetical protein
MGLDGNPDDLLLLLAGCFLVRGYLLNFVVAHVYQ